MFDFFFSSRRRHTRWNCDWSSDVCSSDLASIRGPYDATQFVPSLYGQLASFAGKGGAKPNRSFLSIANNGALQTIGRQTPITRRIDLWWIGVFAGLHIETE